MSTSLDELVVKADAVISAQDSASSTRMQYRWAWARFRSFRSHDGDAVFTEAEASSFVRFVAAEHRAGRYKGWKAKLLRKAVLVPSEVAATGSYQWRLSKQTHPNDVLDAVFRPVQEQFETWPESQELAVATQNLYATVARRILAWLPERGVKDIGALTAADLAAAVVFLGRHYRPGN